MVDAERRCPGEKRAKAESGTIVSIEVETAAPVEALVCPLAASELVARLRAESAAIVAAVLCAPVVDLNNPAAMPVCWVPVGLAPAVET